MCKYIIVQYGNLETLTFSIKIHVTILPFISSIDDTGKSVAGGSPEPDAGVTPHGSAASNSDGRRLFTENRPVIITKHCDYLVILQENIMRLDLV